MTVAAQLLRQARHGAGCTQSALARRAEVAPSRLSEIERSVSDPTVHTLDRVVRAAGQQLTVLPTRSPSAAGCAAAISDILATSAPRSAERRAFRTLIGFSDGLKDADPALRVALSVGEPASTGDPRFDAAIAAVVEQHLATDRLPIPAWVDQPHRRLEEPWVPDPHAPADIEHRTSAAFRRHGVLLAESELASV